MPKDLYPAVPVTQGLAAERTVLAAERTLLAYMRTGLGLLVAGVSGAHFLDDTRMDLVALLLVIISVVIIVYGVSRFRSSRALTRKMLERLMEPPSPSS